MITVDLFPSSLVRVKVERRSCERIISSAPINHLDKAYQSLLQESLCATFPLGNDIVLVAFSILVQPQPDTTEIQFLHERLSDVLPVRMYTRCLDSAKRRPIAIVQEHLEAGLLVQLSRHNIEDNNARFWKQVSRSMLQR